MDDKDVIPYNIDNVIIKIEDITKMFSKFNLIVIPNDINLYIKAMTHKSYTKKEYEVIPKEILLANKQLYPSAPDLFDESNETLEFLGDSVIKLIVADYLHERYFRENEGFLTRLKTKVEDRDSLAQFARRLGIDDFMIIAKCVEDNRGRNSNKLLEDCFEAFMGALYKDLGFDICKKFMRIILETEVLWSDIQYINTNYKNSLLNFYHQNHWDSPKYVTITSEGPNNKQIFRIGVKDNEDVIIAVSSASSKKLAEQRTAMVVLYINNIITKEQLLDVYKIEDSNVFNDVKIIKSVFENKHIDSHNEDVRGKIFKDINGNILASYIPRKR